MTLGKKKIEKEESKSKIIVLLKSYQKTIQISDNGVYENGERTFSGSDAQGHGYQLVRDYYKNFLAQPFENIIVLSGAGTSKSSGGKIMTELWEDAFPEEKKTKNEEFFRSIKFPIPISEKDKNLEGLLSQAQKAREILNDVDSKKVGEKINEVESLIVRACTLKLGTDAPHLKFLNKITSRKLKYSRIKIFTLNYDTLFEQAAVKGNFIVINGFSFSNPSYFNGNLFDYDIINRLNSRVNAEENFVEKVFHLYKPHGSINWEKLDQGEIVSKEINSASDRPLIIYPNSNKYESGYDQPFFEMMSRFQQAIRQSNTLLICVGFSFGDKHFKNVIQETIKSNPGLSLVVFMPDFSDRDSFSDLIELSEKQNNIIFVNENFQNLSNFYPFSLEYEHDNGE